MGTALAAEVGCGGFCALHLAQRFASGLPHLGQKLLVEGLFVPHFEQRVRYNNRPAVVYHPAPRTDQQVAREGIGLNFTVEFLNLKKLGVLFCVMMLSIAGSPSHPSRTITAI